MVEKKYFLRLGMVFLFGLVALIIAGLIFVLVLPFIVPVVVSAFFLTVVFIVLWAIIYIAMIIGAAVYYIFKPMEVSEKPKGYSIKQTKEAGKRQRGKS